MGRVKINTIFLFVFIYSLHLFFLLCSEDPSEIIMGIGLQTVLEPWIVGSEQDYAFALIMVKALELNSVASLNI